MTKKEKWAINGLSFLEIVIVGLLSVHIINAERSFTLGIGFFVIITAIYLTIVLMYAKKKDKIRAKQSQPKNRKSKKNQKN